MFQDPYSLVLPSSPRMGPYSPRGGADCFGDILPPSPTMSFGGVLSAQAHEDAAMSGMWATTPTKVEQVAPPASPLVFPPVFESSKIKEGALACPADLSFAAEAPREGSSGMSVTNTFLHAVAEPPHATRVGECKTTTKAEVVPARDTFGALFGTLESDSYAPPPHSPASAESVGAGGSSDAESEHSSTLSSDDGGARASDEEWQASLSDASSASSAVSVTASARHSTSVTPLVEAEVQPSSDAEAAYESCDEELGHLRATTQAPHAVGHYKTLCDMRKGLRDHALDGLLVWQERLEHAKPPKGTPAGKRWLVSFREALAYVRALVPKRLHGFQLRCFLFERGILVQGCLVDVKKLVAQIRKDIRQFKCENKRRGRRRAQRASARRAAVAAHRNEC